MVHPNEKFVQTYRGIAITQSPSPSHRYWAEVPMTRNVKRTIHSKDLDLVKRKIREAKAEAKGR